MNFTSAPIVTYWLRLGKTFVGSVRMPAGSSREAVITKALDQHERSPLCDANEAPFEKRGKIIRAGVFLYPDGNPGEPKVVTEVR